MSWTSQRRLRLNVQFERHAIDAIDGGRKQPMGTCLPPCIPSTSARIQSSRTTELTRHISVAMVESDEDISWRYSAIPSCTLHSYSYFRISTTLPPYTFSCDHWRFFNFGTNKTADATTCGHISKLVQSRMA